MKYQTRTITEEEARAIIANENVENLPYQTVNEIGLQESSRTPLNYDSYKLFKDIEKVHRNAALDINPETGELVCMYTDGGAGIGVGSVPQTYSENWTRVLETGEDTRIPRPQESDHPNFHAFAQFLQMRNDNKTAALDINFKTGELHCVQADVSAPSASGKDWVRMESTGGMQPALQQDEACLRERESRIAKLNTLQEESGAALTFWKTLAPQLDAVGKDPNLIVWQDIEDKAAQTSILQHRQDPYAVFEAISSISPGTVDETSRHRLQRHIEEVCGIQHSFEKDSPTLER